MWKKNSHDHGLERHRKFPERNSEVQLWRLLTIDLFQRKKGQENQKKEEKNCKSKLRILLRHKTSRKSPIVEARDQSGQCSVQYFENIGQAMEQYDWSCNKMI